MKLRAITAVAMLALIAAACGKRNPVAVQDLSARRSETTRTDAPIRGPDDEEWEAQEQATPPEAPAKDGGWMGSGH